MGSWRKKENLLKHKSLLIIVGSQFWMETQWKCLCDHSNNFSTNILLVPVPTPLADRIQRSTGGHLWLGLLGVSFCLCEHNNFESRLYWFKKCCIHCPTAGTPTKKYLWLVQPYNMFKFYFAILKGQSFAV